MKMNKSILAFMISTLLTDSFSVANPVSHILSNIPTLLDTWLASGGQTNYARNFPQENLQKIKHGYEFNNLVTLGDSISDQGSGGRQYIYIAGGYDNPIYAELLSLSFTGKRSSPAYDGGLNYSLRGASTLKIEKNRRSIQEQYQLFLKEYGDKVDAKSLYILWGGNMDMNILVANNFATILLGRYDLNKLNKIPQANADMAQDLINRGAPYVFVPNIPDGVLFPYNMMSAIEQVVGVLGTFKIPHTWLIVQAGRAIDGYLRDPKNTRVGEGRDFFRNNHINAMHSKIYFFLPKFLVAFLYDTIAYLQDKTIQHYNYTLNNALSHVNGNIVYFDFDSLTNELAYNYKDYGFDTVLVPTCTLGYSSRFCDTNSPEFHPQISLFSDWFHPSPEFHVIIAQTMQAIFNAPVYASSIARQADSINLARTFFLNSELDNLRYQNNLNISSPSIFMGYTGSSNTSGVYVEKNRIYTNILNIGMYSYLNPQWIMGGAISLGFGKNKPHDNFQYNFNHQNLSFFTQYTFNNHLWANFNLGIGRLSANDIARYTSIYKTIVVHKGKTKAYAYNVLARIGTDIYKDEYQQTGPVIELGLNKYKVNAYQESGKKFLAMKYDQHHYTKNHIGLGWYYNNQSLEVASKPIQISFEATINHQLGNSKFKIPASLITAPIMFKREIRDIKKQWINAKVGAKINLNKDSYLSSSLGYSTDLKRNKNVNYTIGFNYQL